jgi:DNA topoisomerase I
MGKKLVIVESPAKAKTIGKYLGEDFVVKASMGHVRDLPQKKIGIDIERGFVPEYVPVSGRKKVIDELRKAAKGADEVYLAPDPDREGEAIAWHLQHLLEDLVDPDRFHRVTYQEITKSAINAAFSQPGQIDMQRVDSQQARRVLDRIVGYKVSPLLWRRVAGAASAGRVQSAALRILCEREDEIDKFKPEEYWDMGAKVRKYVDPRTPFLIKLAKIDGAKAEVKDADSANAIKAELEGRNLLVAAINEREVRKSARPPYITSSLQQAGSSVLGFTPSRTMRVAQTLYEGMDLGEGTEGLITYMRTDSFNLSKQAVDSIRAWVTKNVGADYLPKSPNRYKSRGGAQEAHEAIRPTNFERTPESVKSWLDRDQYRLYKLIWERAVASQMAPARIAQRSVEFQAEEVGRYIFSASDSKVIFDGYMRVSGQEKNKSEDGEDEKEARLPALNEGEKIELLEWTAEQKFTKPPNRFSEAGLVKVLEENGVGRPSTYAQTLATLVQRDYAEKRKRILHPTPLGRRTNQFLSENLDQLFNVKFTAEMEQELDEIEDGKLEMNAMLSDFYLKFNEWMKSAKGPKGDAGEVRELVRLLSHVNEWAPPVKRGKRSYDDQKFVSSMEQLAAGDSPNITQRQVDALKTLAVKYIAQVPELAERAEELGLKEMILSEKDKIGPLDSTLRKLELLENIDYDEPRKVGKRVYDDKAFISSLRDQAKSGRKLSEKQIQFLDRFIKKYSQQIADYEKVAEELGLSGDDAPEDTKSQAMLELMKSVREWSEPVKKGKRVLDDKEFYESLSRQFREKHSLSTRQQYALKRMIKKYADQIPDFENHKDELGIES